VVIGSEMSGDVRNVVISNCIFMGTDRGIRLKSRRGRGGVVEDIRVTNVVMTEVLCPFILNLYYGPGAWGARRISDKSPWPVDEGTPRFRRIHFGHVTAREVQYAAAFIYGLAEMPVEEISFDDVRVSLAPDAREGNPAMAPDIPPMQRAGVFARNARGLRFRNIEVSGQLGPAVNLSEVADVEIGGGVSPTPDAETSLIRLENVDGAFVHGCVAPPGTGTFLQVEGQATRGIVLSGNRLEQAREPLSLAEGVSPDAVSG
jgi:hypothetical protein